MKQDPKKLAMLIIGKGKPKEPEEAEEMSSDEGDYSDEAKDETAQGIWDAVKADDFEAFKVSLKEYVEECIESAGG